MTNAAIEHDKVLGPVTEKSRRPTTLLLTSTRPGVGTVGELFLSSLCKLFRPGELYCTAGVSVYDIPVLDPELEWLSIDSFNLPKEYEWQYDDEPKFKKLLHGFRPHIDRLRSDLNQSVDQVVAFIEREKIELLWFVLNSPSMVIMADAILQRTAIPSMAIVWDPIRSTAEQHKMKRRSQDQLETIFDGVIGKIKALGVASPGMQEYFRAKNLPTRVLINTPPFRQNSIKERATDKLIISFAGSIYAHKEFKSLIKALNFFDWRIAERDVELQVFTHFFDLPIPAWGKRVNILFRGHLREGALLEALASSHVAYLPYWFDKEYEAAVKTCFPNKLASYVAAGCPILYQGPAESAPASFLERYRVGKSVHSTAADQLADTLKFLVADPEFLANYERERQQARHEELSTDIFRDRFLELLSIATAVK